MEKKLRKKIETNWKNILATGLVVVGMIGLTVACATPQVDGTKNFYTPTPIVWQKETPFPPLPSPTATFSPTPSSTPSPMPTLKPAPTARPTEKPTVKPTPIVKNCNIYSGSSSPKRVGDKLAEEFPDSQKKIDTAKYNNTPYSIITLSDKNNNKTVFITQNGSLVQFVKDMLTNPSYLSMLPCKPDEVYSVNILTGGNNETGLETADEIATQLVTTVNGVATVFKNADFIRVYLPYPIPADDPPTIEKRKRVDEIVTAQLREVKRVSVIPLRTLCMKTENELEGEKYEDKWHWYPEDIIKAFGGRERIFQFPDNAYSN